jgi:hypothetical protein
VCVGSLSELTQERIVLVLEVHSGGRDVEVVCMKGSGVGCRILQDP